MKFLKNLFRKKQAGYYFCKIKFADPANLLYARRLHIKIYYTHKADKRLETIKCRTLKEAEEIVKGMDLSNMKFCFFCDENSTQYALKQTRI